MDIANEIKKENTRTRLAVNRILQNKEKQSKEKKETKSSAFEKLKEIFK